MEEVPEMARLAGVASVTSILAGEPGECHSVEAAVLRVGSGTWPSTADLGWDIGKEHGVNESSGWRTVVAAVAGFAAAAVLSFLAIRWAFGQWGLGGGFVALLVAPETLGYLAYMAVAMVLGGILSLIPRRHPSPQLGQLEPAGGTGGTDEQVTVPVMGVGPVTFTRRRDGEVVFDLPAGSHPMTAGVVVREGYLELTKQQLTQGKRDPWCPDLLEQARLELSAEATATDEQGRQVRSVVSGGRVISFTQQQDGTVAMAADPGERPANALQQLSAHLAEETAPLLLTKVQLRRGEPVWFPDLEGLARNELKRDGFHLGTPS